MKVFEKLKKIGKRCKVVVATAAAAVVGVVSSVCASAATVEASTGASTGYDLSKALTDAGTSVQNQFGVLVTTLIPVIIGILTAGLVIFGIMQLIKLAKKTFGKVAG